MLGKQNPRSSASSASAMRTSLGVGGKLIDQAQVITLRLMDTTSGLTRPTQEMLLPRLALAQRKQSGGRSASTVAGSHPHAISDCEPCPVERAAVRRSRQRYRNPWPCFLRKRSLQCDAYSNKYWPCAQVTPTYWGVLWRTPACCNRFVDWSR